MHSKPHSKREIKEFTKFGVEYKLSVVTDYRQEWVQAVKDKNGNSIDVNDPDELKKYNQDDSVTLSWEPTDNSIECKYVAWAKAKDPERMSEFEPIKLMGTPDGPILGIVLDHTKDHYRLLDPCVVQYVRGQVQLFPIFNVARELELKTSAVKTEQPPADILIGCYPGFVVQNKMAKYQLKMNTPMASSPEVDNEGSSVVQDTQNSSIN